MLKRKVIISINFWDVLKEYLYKFCDRIIKVKKNIFINFVIELLKLKRFNTIFNIIN